MTILNQVEARLEHAQYVPFTVPANRVLMVGGLFKLVRLNPGKLIVYVNGKKSMRLMAKNSDLLVSWRLPNSEKGPYGMCGVVPLVNSIKAGHAILKLGTKSFTFDDLKKLGSS